MRLVLLLIFFSCNSLVIGQDTIGLRKVITALDMALLTKDTLSIEKIIATNISYGHSNGWMQTKQDLINDFTTGKIEYKKIESGEGTFVINKKAVAVRCITKVEGVVNGTAFNMSLQVLQVWKKVKNSWILIARQSVKMS